MKSIKIKPHVTVAQLLQLKRKGALIEINSFSVFVSTDNVFLVNVINKINKGE